jgi:hypothetical protein
MDAIATGRCTSIACSVRPPRATTSIRTRCVRVVLKTQDGRVACRPHARGAVQSRDLRSGDGVGAPSGTKETGGAGSGTTIQCRSSTMPRSRAIWTPSLWNPCTSFRGDPRRRKTSGRFGPRPGCHIVLRAAVEARVGDSGDEGSRARPRSAGVATRAGPAARRNYLRTGRGRRRVRADEPAFPPMRAGAGRPTLAP